jgi:hypothetical protein
MYRAMVLPVVVVGLCLAPACQSAPAELSTISAAATIDGQEYLGVVELTGPLKLMLDWDPVVRRVELITAQGIRIAMLVNFDFADVGGVPLHLPDKVLNQQGRILISRRSLQKVFGFLESSGWQTTGASTPPANATSETSTQPPAGQPAEQSNLIPIAATPTAGLPEPATPEAQPVPDTPAAELVAGQPPQSAPSESGPGIIAQATFALDMHIPEGLPPERRTDLQAAFAWLAERLQEHLAAHSIAVWMPPPGANQSSKDLDARRAGVSAWLGLSAASSAAAVSAIGYAVFLPPAEGATDPHEQLANALVAELQQTFPEAAIPGPRRSRLEMLAGISVPAVLLEIDLPPTWRFAGSPVSRGHLNHLAAICGDALLKHSGNQTHE